MCLKLACFFFFCQMIHFTWLPSTDIKFKLNYFCHRLAKKNGCVTVFNTTSPGAPRNLGFIGPHQAPFVYCVVLVILKERFTRVSVCCTQGLNGLPYVCLSCRRSSGTKFWPWARHDFTHMLYRVYRATIAAKLHHVWDAIQDECHSNVRCAFCWELESWAESHQFCLWFLIGQIWTGPYYHNGNSSPSML